MYTLICINIIKLYIIVVISCFNKFTNTKKKIEEIRIKKFICLLLLFGDGAIFLGDTVYGVLILIINCASRLDSIKSILMRKTKYSQNTQSCNCCNICDLDFTIAEHDLGEIFMPFEEMINSSQKPTGSRLRLPLPFSLLPTFQNNSWHAREVSVFD